MKICFIAKGESYHAQRWAKALSDFGLDIHLISSVQVDLPGVEQVNVPIYSSNIFTQMINNRNLINTINDLNPDIIHLFGLFPLASFGTMQVSRHLNPLLISVLGSDIIPGRDKISQKRNIIKRFLLNKADRILATSVFLKNKTSEFTNECDKIEVLPWGVDIEKFIPSNERTRKDYLVIGFAKTLYHLSGPDILLEAFNIAKEKCSRKLILKIAGKGEKEYDFMKKAESLGITDSTEWCGWLEGDDLPEFYRSVDVFVMPSRKESFGMSALEAAACGIPVIGTDVGGISEVVRDGKTGMLVASENPEQVADAIVQLAENDDLRLKMGKAGRKMVEDSFDWKTTVNEITRIYSELTSKDEIRQ